MSHVIVLSREKQLQLTGFYEKSCKNLVYSITLKLFLPDFSQILTNESEENGHHLRRITRCRCFHNHFIFPHQVCLPLWEGQCRWWTLLSSGSRLKPRGWVLNTLRMKTTDSRYARFKRVYVCEFTEPVPISSFFVYLSRLNVGMGIV